MSRRQTDPAGIVATTALAVAVTSLWVGLGGTVAPARWIAAGAVGAAGVAAAFALRGADDPPRKPLRWGWTALLLLPGAVSLLPLPSPLVSLLSPLRAEVSAIGPLARDPDGARSALAVGLLAWGAGAVVSALPGWRHRDVERAAVAALALACAVAVTHAAAGLGGLFGVITPTQAVPTLFAPFVDPNHFAAAALLLAPLAAGAWDSTSGRGADPRGWLLGAALVALAFVYADARAALVALAFAVAVRGTVLAEARAKKTGHRSPFLAWWWAIPAVAAIGVVATVAVGESGRGPVWAATARMIAAHPWVGVGPGGFARAFPTFVTEPTIFRWSHAHSDPLQYVAETGLVGVIVGMIAIGAWASRVNGRDPRARRALAGVGLLAAVSLVEFPLHLPLILVLGAMSAAWTLRADGSPAAGRALAASGALAAAAGLALDLVPTQDAQATRDVDAAVVALRAGDRATATATARRLASTFPDVPRWTHRAARLLTAADQPDDAVAVSTTALRWAPFDEQLWVDRAEARCALGDGEAGAQDYAQALRIGGHHTDLRAAVACFPIGLWWVSALDGASPGHLEHLAAVLLEDRDPAGALMAIDAAAVADPGRYGASLLEARAWEQLGDRAKALGEASRVAADRPNDPEQMRLVAELRARLGDDAGATEAWALAARERRWIPAWVASVQRSRGAEEALRVAASQRLLGRGSPELDVLIAELERAP